MINTQCWYGYGKKRILIYFGEIINWCNLSREQYGNINALKMWLHFDQSISILGLYSKEIIIRRRDKNVCTKLLTTMLFIIAKENGIKIGDCLNKFRYNNTIGYATHSKWWCRPKFTDMETRLQYTSSA